jgi:tRNA (guanine37-N1)-methyltransferase
MKYSVISLFPEIIQDYCSKSIIGRAQKNNIISLETINPRDFTSDNYHRVDDMPYGGGSGMVLMCDPIFQAFEAIKKLENYRLILTTPQGTPYNQQIASDLSNCDQLIIISGHYEGIDERIRLGLKPFELSAGDYILTGGELVTLCIIDSTTRLLPGALGKDDSLKEESFNNYLLEYPHYTRPSEYRGMKVPDILLSGHHKNIANWRKQQSLINTFKKRPDLLNKADLTKEDQHIIEKIKNSKEKE